MPLRRGAGRRGAAWLLLPLLLAFPAMAGAADTCMAGICLNTAINQKTLVAKYGPGRLRIEQSEVPEIRQRCYYDKQQGLYIEFTFDIHGELNSVSDLTEIVVSTVPMCPKRYAPKRPFPRMVTESGLRVGLTEAEVETALGRPQRIDDVAELEHERMAGANGFTQEMLMRNYAASVFGSPKWMYIPDPNDLLFNAFFMADGTVKSLWLSVSE